jgi:hypothetical protein
MESAMPESLTGNETAADPDLDVDVKSTNPDPGAAAEHTTEGVDQSASPADKGERPEDLLSAVRLALEPKDEGKAAAPAAGEAKPEQPAAQDGAEKTAADPAAQADADKLLPFHKHPRWIEVMGERNEALRKVDLYKADHEALQGIRGYMAQHNLQDAEVQNGFAIMAAIKTDPARALTMLQPYITELQKVLGHELPDDLRERVEEGRTDEESAKELARARATLQRTQASAAERANQEAQAALVAQGNARAAAADNWVATQQTTDPDFARKAPLLKGAVLEIVAEWDAQGKPVRTAEDAVAITKAAYQRTTDRLRAALPAKPTIRHVPSSNSSSQVAGPRPKTLREAAERGLAQGASA